MRRRRSWFRWLVVGLLLALGAGGCIPAPGFVPGAESSPALSTVPGATRAPAGPETASRASTTPPRSPSGASGLRACVPAELPPEVADAVVAVRNDGPYLRPRNDGGIFGNRERLLPRRSSSYYREYTVAAPGERFPGPRRLVTGGQRRTGDEPEIWFYTADHYESFCELLDP